MAGESSYVRIPPDSTGKKIRHQPFLRVGFNKVITDHIWVEQGQYKITGSATQLVTIFKGPAVAAQAGYLGVRATESATYNDYNPVNGDAIQYLINDVWTTVATVSSSEYIHIPYSHISGGDSPHNTANVDGTGSLNVRFAEGLPQLDAFGKLRTSAGTAIGEYIFSNNELPQDFSTRKYGAGNLTWNENRHCIRLSVPGGVVPGALAIDDIRDMDSVCHTSNTYHHYFPGFSQLWMGTVAMGDDGSSAPTCERRFGYFDDRNGYYFMLQGDVMNVCIRSDTEVLPQQNAIENAIPQSEWNVDKLDGTGASQMILDVTDDVLYWVDIQWLGAGRCRFGVYHKGQRITCHEYYHLDNGGKPHSASGSLPANFSICNYEQINFDATMSVWCSAVHTEHNANMQTSGANRLATLKRTFDPTAPYENGQEYELMGVLSPVRTIGDAAHVNRQLYLPNYMEVLAYHEDGTEAYVEVEVYLDPIIGGGAVSFAIDSDEVVNQSTYGPWLVPTNKLDTFSGVEYYRVQDFVDAGLTFNERPKFWANTGGHVLATYARGNNTVDLSNLYANYQNGAFKNYANSGGTEDHAAGTWTVSPDGSTATRYSSAMGMLRHREGYPIRFYGIEGTASSVLNYSENGEQDFYLRITDINEAELYYDLEFTMPVITNGLTVTAPGRMRAFYGSQMYFVVVCKAIGPSVAQVGKYANVGDITVHFNLGWSEINQ